MTRSNQSRQAVPSLSFLGKGVRGLGSPPRNNLTAALALKHERVKACTIDDTFARRLTCTHHLRARPHARSHSQRTPPHADTEPLPRRALRRVLIYDGAMGTSIQRSSLTAEDFGGERRRGLQRLPRDHPARRHREHPRFLPRQSAATCWRPTPSAATGSSWTSTAWASACYEINRAAAAAGAPRGRPLQHARAAALRRRLDRADRHAAVVDDPTLGNITFDELVADLPRAGQGAASRAAWMCCSIETSQDILEVKAAHHRHRAAASPSRAAACPSRRRSRSTPSGRMLLGTDIARALTTLEALRVDVIGLNCSTGPEHMREPVRYLAENIAAARSRASPTPGCRSTRDGEAVYPLRARAAGRDAAEFVSEFGVQHRRRLLRHDAGAHRRWSTRVARSAARAAPGIRAHAARVCQSAMRAIDAAPGSRAALVGERVNAQGSRKVKRLLLADDYDGMLRSRASRWRAARTCSTCWWR